jgi:hypothetical protein
MHDKNCEQNCEHMVEEETKKRGTDKNFLALSILAAAGIISVGLVYSSSIRAGAKQEKPSGAASAEAQVAAADPLEAQVFPRSVELPVVWGDLGKRMIQAGVIDQAKFEALYAGRGGMTAEMKSLLSGANNGNLIITQENSAYVLNLLWALGLGQQSPVLTNGPMMNNASVKPENFASTGGWTLGAGDTMAHYAKHNLLNLTAEQQRLVEKVAKGIYRPCCGNSTYFPDCNHGMGMLGLLELMASQGANETSMYQAALYANSYWFPDTYLTLANYFKNQGISWDKVDPSVVLGQQYSSSGGFQNVASQVQQAAPQNNAVTPRKTSPGCGA